MDVLHYTQLESSPGYKAIDDYAMLYLGPQIMTNLKFLGDLKNNQINPWPERNSMALDQTIVKV